MKKILFAFIALCLSTSLLAQVPQQFKYQGVARDAGNLVIGGIGLQLSILEGGPSGTLKYQERHFPNTNDFGVFSVSVGTGTIISGDWNTIGWATGDIYLQVELDPAGGASYTDMGTSQLLSVPFALYGEDADADPTNEMQTWTNLPGIPADLLDGDNVDDADANPSNEIQTISLVGEDLMLSPSGGTVNLAPVIAAGSLWDPSGNNINYNSGYVGIGTTSPSSPLHVESPDITSGVISGTFSGTTSSDVPGVTGYSVPTDYYGIGGLFTGGYIGVRSAIYPTGDDNYYGAFSTASGGSGTNYGLYASASGGATNYAGYFNGDVYVNDDFEAYGNSYFAEQDIYLSNGSSGGGYARISGPNGNSNFVFSSVSGTSNHGWMGIYNSAGSNRLLSTVLTSGEGFLQTYGPNGQGNIRLTTLLNYSNNGYVAVIDAGGTTECGLYINSSGDGVMFADIKNFRMDHPEQEDKEIWYVSLEGPEAAAYERGTGTLVNGEVVINFSDHFGLVGNHETMTVILTPLSANTYGLAVVEKTATGFKVKELMNGTGSFQFDWEVKAVRKGYEAYEVVRDKSESLPSLLEQPEPTPPARSTAGLGDRKDLPPTVLDKKQQ